MLENWEIDKEEKLHLGAERTKFDGSLTLGIVTWEGKYYVWWNQQNFIAQNVNSTL